MPMRDIIDEQIKKDWRPDPNESYARITITPIVGDGQSYFQINERLQIHPYPNPLGFGGLWGGSSVSTREEAVKAIANFRESWVKEWEARGMKPLEVIWQPEMTLATRRNQLTAEARESAVKAGRSTKGLTQIRLF